MKKYTQPTVEITAFDFEDIICDSSSSLNAANYENNIDTFKANQPANTVIVEW